MGTRKEDVCEGNTILLNDSANFLPVPKELLFRGGRPLGDSLDSRYWGLLPKEYIVGVASRI